MIIVKLDGGMGNQMFQYALGRALAACHSCEFKMDTSSFEDGFDQALGTTARKYALNCFNVKNEIASKAEIEKVYKKANSKIGRYIQLVIQRVLNIRRKTHFLEQGHAFQPNVFSAIGDTYFEGYWQSEKYFSNIASVIRSDFSLKKEFQIDNLDVAMQMRCCNSVSMHIRRTDYLKHSKVFSICSLEYYQRAVAYINDKVVDPVFFIFSDDIDWVKENLTISGKTVYVTDGKLKDYEELTLMSFCKHNVIANSTFSWWGAWLNPNQEKIVVAPNQWFATTSINAKDIIPETWIKL